MKPLNKTELLPLPCSCPTFHCCCRQLKRLRDEEGSRFQGQPLLHRRYVLAALLGRGGFSEVHKAYDTQSLKFVAVKVSCLGNLLVD